MEAIAVPTWSRAAGKSLGMLAPARDFGVQIAGIHRQGVRILNPSAVEVLRAGDDALVLGTPVQIAEFKAWLREPPDQADELKSD